MTGSKRVIVASFAGALLSAVPMIVETTIAYQPLIYAVSDGLWLPGALVARLFYPAGIHTGLGSSAYVPLSVTFNFSIYFALVFGILMLLPRFRSNAEGSKTKAAHRSMRVKPE